MGSLAIATLLVGVRQAGTHLGEPPAVSRRWIGASAGFLLTWFTCTGLLAAAGLLADFTRQPPPLLLLIALTMLLTVTLAGSRFGGRLVAGLPIAWLVGYQAFRIPVEIVLLALHQTNALPIRMSIAGRNWDLLSGLSAILVAWLATRGRLPTWGLLVWNILGLGLLLNIVGIALLSMPLPFRMFWNEPANTFITQLPSNWLPTFLAPMALFGHLLIFRVLWHHRGRDALQADMNGGQPLQRRTVAGEY